MDKDDTLKKFDWELKKRKVKDAAHNAKARATTFYYNHEGDIKAIAPVVGGLLIVGAKGAIKDHRKQKERDEADSWHYDFRDHEWYESRRPLNNREKLELKRYYDAGMSKGDALKKMRLLKR